MTFRSIAFWAACAVALAVTPASAMHWIIYAPDETGYRYWLDADSIQVKGDYTYATYVLGAPDSSAPTTPEGQHIGINCKTGDSVWVRGGQETPGPHFTDAAYLFKSLCENK